MTELDHERPASMGPPVLDLASILHFPQPDRPILAAGGQDIGVRPPTESRDRSAVATQVLVDPSGLGFPDKQSTVAVRTGHQDAVGAESRAVDPVGVFLGHLPQQFARPGRIDTESLAGTSQCNQLVVGTDVGTQDGVEFLAYFNHTFSALHIPNHHLAVGGSAATTGQQQAAIAAEAQRVREALGIRQDSDKFQRASVVEQHLFLASHGTKRRPGTGGQGGNSRGGLGDQLGTQSQPVGVCGILRTTRRRPLERKVELGLLANEFAAGVFQHPAVDPGLDCCQLLGRELWRLRRHERFGFVVDQAPEVAVRRCAGLDHLATATTDPQLAVGRQIEIALFLVRPMTGEAASHEDRSHVVLVSDLLGLLIGGRLFLVRSRHGGRNHQEQGDTEQASHLEGSNSTKEWSAGKESR